MSALVGAVPRRSRVPMRCELQPGQLWTFSILCPFFSPLMVRQVARHFVCMRPGQHGKYMGSSTPVSVSSCPCMQMRHSSSSATCCCNTGAGTVAEACTALQDAIVAGHVDPGLPSGFSGLMWPRAPGRRQHVSCLERFAPGRPFGIFITSASCSRSVASAGATCFGGRPGFLFWPSARRSSCSRLRFLSLSRRFCSPGLPSVLRGRPQPRFAIGAGTVAEACTALQDAVVAGPGDPGLPSGFSGLMWPRAPGRRQHVSCLERFAPGRPFGIFITSASCSRSVASAATGFGGRPGFLFWPSARRSSCSRLRFLSLSRRFCSPGLPSVMRGRPRPRFAIGRRTDRAAHFGTRKGGSRTLSRGGAVTCI